MERTLPLHKDATVILNASGNGNVSLGPGRLGVTWNVTQAMVKVTTHVKEAQAQLSSFPRQLPGTYSGSSGDTAGMDLILTGAQQLTCTWTGGDVGATATLTIYGTQTITGG